MCGGKEVRCVVNNSALDLKCNAQIVLECIKRLFSSVSITLSAVLGYTETSMWHKEVSKGIVFGIKYMIY